MPEQSVKPKDCPRSFVENIKSFLQLSILQK